ncbi:MAG TPA: Nramp family divalent metal transporter [Bryobacteraceae bacterium]|nr:Nramp family divalent metal transporter [Bryobacteraceae bacterium]
MHKNRAWAVPTQQAQCAQERRIPAFVEWRAFARYSEYKWYLIVFPGNTAPSRSLSDVHESVRTDHGSLWRRVFAFSGPAYLVSVGYMDPGNWATDLDGGAHFGYRLLWVLVMSNAMAILLQTLGARLGIVTGRDLAQACRETYPKTVNLALWFLCEMAIVACDLAEVLGAAIALNLLFHIPLLVGVGLTALDTLLVLWMQKLGIRYLEAVIFALIAIIAVCFAAELFMAKPEVAGVMRGIVPWINNRSLYTAIAMLGATVMPHNLYLHSALVQTRDFGRTAEEKRAACKWNLVDCTVALNGAMLINCAILILAAAVFFRAGKDVTQIQQAYLLLAPLMGTVVAAKLFGVALFASGQSSTLTGTLAGQIIMEGFLNIRIRPWLRRLVTRSLAIIPALVVIWLSGGEGTFRLLLLSQVVLSLQLPFAIVPLIQFTNDPLRMGHFASGLKVRIAGWATALIVLALNLWLAWQVISAWGHEAGNWAPLVWTLALAVCGALLWLLVWISLQPYYQRSAGVPATLGLEQRSSNVIAAPVYQKILVPLDHSSLDRIALGHAAALAAHSHGTIYLLHVEEGVTSQIYGSDSSTAEVEAGREYLNSLVESLGEMKIHVETAMRHSMNPRKEIVNYAREIEPDLLVMGAHGHGGIKDLIFGNTINPVRHELNIPILVVRK